MNLLITALLCLVASVASGQEALPRALETQRVSITVQPRWSEGDRHFAISVSFDARGRKTTPVALPDEWAGAGELWRGIRNLRVTSAQATLSPTSTPQRRLVTHAPQGLVTLTYELIDFGGNTFNRSRLYQPQIDRDYALFFGRGAWVLPAWHEQQPLDVSIEVIDVPRGWAVASSYGVAPADATRVTWRERSQHAGLLWHTLFAFGDFRMHRAEVRGRPFWVGLRGRHKFDDATFVSRARGLIEAHRAFFSDFDVPFLLMTLMPNGVTDGYSYGGTAVWQAFAMHVSDDFTVPGPGFDFLIGHEHLHGWVPRRYGSMTAPGRENTRDDALYYWFSEGFTNWLTHRLLLASGQWTLDQYATSLNETVRRYETSSARKRPNSEVPASFFTDNDIGQLPYQRGELLALHWDSQLSTRGTSLAQLLRSMLLPPPPHTQRPPLATERLFAALQPTLGNSPRNDVARWVDNADPIDYHATLGGPCLTVTPTPIGTFELGFDQSSLDTRTVKGLIPGSAAARAGLKEGDELKGYSVQFGDVARDVSLQVARGKQAEKIIYRPLSIRTSPGAVFGVKSGAASEAACKAWVAMR